MAATTNRRIGAQKVTQKKVVAKTEAPPVVVEEIEDEIEEYEEVEDEAEDLPDTVEGAAQYIDEALEAVEEEVGAAVIHRVLTFDDIMAAADLQEEMVKVPEWGENGVVWTRPITKGEFDAVIKMVKDDDGNTDANKMKDMFFIAGLTQPRISVEQLEMLKSKNAAPYMRILTSIMRRSGMESTPEEAAAAEVAREKTFRP
jgi:hypothetical protein